MINKYTKLATLAGCIVILLLWSEAVRAAVRIPLTLLLIFILPGHSLTALIFPRDTLRTSERLLFTITTSIIIVILGGMLLNMTPWGLQTYSWIITLISTTTLVYLIVWMRRKKSRIDIIPPIKIGLKPYPAILMTLAVLVLGVALHIAYTPSAQLDFQGYTLLWMTPTATTNKYTVDLGINSMEFSETSYRVMINIDGENILEWPSIKLKPKGQWKTTIDLSNWSGHDLTNGHVEALLYRLDTPDSIYRHVTIWLNQ